MDYPFTVESQEQLDGIISGRIQRIKAQYSDYEDIKNSLNSALEERNSLNAKVEELTNSNKTLTDEVSGFKAANELRELRSAVASEMGVPESVLRGSDKGELEAHATALKELLKPQGGASVPSPGAEPEGGDAAGIDFMRRLFGTN